MLGDDESAKICIPQILLLTPCSFLRVSPLTVSPSSMISQFFAPLHVAGLHVALLQQNRLFSSFPLSLAELFL
jgi:hypothetical protein